MSEEAKRSAVKARLAKSGLSHARDSDVEYLISAHEAKMLPRKMMKDERYLALLNEDGLRDPKAAWFLTAKPCIGALVTIGALSRAKSAGMKTVQLRSGQTAAGDCSFLRASKSAKFPIGKAEPLPSMTCEHPDQCGCVWQSVMDW